MNEIEIYKKIVSLSSDYKPKKQEVMNISSLCFTLASFQVRDKTMVEIEFKEHEIEFYNLFEGYYPNKIIKNGQYLSQLNRVLTTFPTRNYSPYKKFTQAIFLTAKFLSHYTSFEAFKKEIQAICIDDKSTMNFMLDFRKVSNLSNMYFIKTCKFFSETWILDVPVPDAKAKKILLPLLMIEDDNKKLYQAMNRIAKSNEITLHELNERIQTID